jgi:hypothetical protein
VELAGCFVAREELRRRWQSLTKKERQWVRQVDRMADEVADETILSVIAERFAGASARHYAVRYYHRHKGAVLGKGTPYPPCPPD